MKKSFEMGAFGGHHSVWDGLTLTGWASVGAKKTRARSVLMCADGKQGRVGDHV